MKEAVSRAADEIKDIVREKGYRKIIVHLPAGVMPYAGYFRDCAPEVFFLADPCFGGCDVPLHYLEKLGAEAIFNIAHSKPLFLKLPGNVHFIELQIKRVPEFVPPCDRVGLVYVIQYREASKLYAKKLEKAGKEVVWGKGPGFMATHPAQVTGCDIEAARKIAGEVDCFVVCADGMFHASAVASLGKKTYNWYGEEAEPVKYPLALLSVAKKVGILLSIKPGQFYRDLAFKLKEELEKAGKEVIIVVGDTIGKEIANYQVDLWVVAACPRIAEDIGGIPATEALNYLRVATGNPSL